VQIQQYQVVAETKPGGPALRLLLLLLSMSDVKLELEFVCWLSYLVWSGLVGRFERGISEPEGPGGRCKYLVRETGRDTFSDSDLPATATAIARPEYAGRRALPWLLEQSSLQ